MTSGCLPRIKKKKHKSKKVYCLEIISIRSANPASGRQYGFLIFLILCFELWNKFRLLSFYASLKDGGLQVIWKSFANEQHNKQHSRQHAAVIFQNRLAVVIYLYTQCHCGAFLKQRIYHSEYFVCIVKVVTSNTTLVCVILIVIRNKRNKRTK